MARSMTRGPSAAGMPTAMGLVPKIGSEDPCGATYSGDWHSTSPIKPCPAICSAQYLHAGLNTGHAAPSLSNHGKGAHAYTQSQRQSRVTPQSSCG